MLEEVWGVGLVEQRRDEVRGRDIEGGGLGRHDAMDRVVG